MLKSAEHEMLNAHKYNNIKKFSFFQTQILSLACYFAPNKYSHCHNNYNNAIVGILTFMSRTNFMLS